MDKWSVCRHVCACLCVCIYIFVCFCVCLCVRCLLGEAMVGIESYISKEMETLQGLVHQKVSKCHESVSFRQRCSMRQEASRTNAKQHTAGSKQCTEFGFTFCCTASLQEPAVSYVTVCSFIRHDGSIYTWRIEKCYKSELFPPRLPVGKPYPRLPLHSMQINT